MRQRCQRVLAGTDRIGVLAQHDWLDGLFGSGAIKPAELHAKHEKVATSLWSTGVDDEPTRDVIVQALHRDLLGQSRCWYSPRA